MAKRDYYDILNVDRNADAAAVKKAYRKLAMQYHPDRNPGDETAEAKFKEAAEAYEVLSDPQKRARYDQFGHAGVGSGASGGAGYQNMEDIFSRFSEIFQDSGFSSFFGGGGGGGRRRRRGQRGADLRIRLRMTLEEAATGATKKVKLKRKVTCGTCGGHGADGEGGYQTCPTCAGQGEVRQQVGGSFFQQIVVSECPTCKGQGNIVVNRCKTCGGEGRMEEEETMELKIPAGVAHDMTLSIRGMGNAGHRMGEPGDLLVQIVEEPHPHFIREGDDLLHELFISFADAVTGATVEIPTLGSRIRFKIEPATQSGTLKRVKGKGMPKVNGYGTGDLIVLVNVWTPTHLNDEERKALKALGESPRMKPTEDARPKRGFFQRFREMFNQQG